MTTEFTKALAQIDHLVKALEQIERLEREGPREGSRGLLIRDAIGEIARAALKTVREAS